MHARNCTPINEDAFWIIFECHDYQDVLFFRGLSFPKSGPMDSVLFIQASLFRESTLRGPQYILYMGLKQLVQQVATAKQRSLVIYVIHDKC